MARTKPHLINILAQNDWPHWTQVFLVRFAIRHELLANDTSSAKSPPKRKDWPLLFPGEDRNPFFSYSRYALTGFPGDPKPEFLPRLTEIQADAMDTIEFLASESCVALPQRKGDIHLVNNFSHLHARRRWAEDSGNCERHLMRLSLMDSEYGHALPEALKDRWGAYFDYSQRQGKWMTEDYIEPNFASFRRFDSFFTDESGSHSTGT